MVCGTSRTLCNLMYQMSLPTKDKFSHVTGVFIVFNGTVEVFIVGQYSHSTCGRYYYLYLWFFLQQIFAPPPWLWIKNFLCWSRHWTRLAFYSVYGRHILLLVLILCFLFIVMILFFFRDLSSFMAGSPFWCAIYMWIFIFNCERWTCVIPYTLS